MSFDAYGDESAGASFVAYGTLLLPTAGRDAVEAKIARLKIDYGASDADDLHCRVLFSGDARRKSAWSKLAINDVFDLYSDLVALVKPSLTRTIVTIANKAELPDEIPGGQWEPTDKTFVGSVNWASGWPFRDKQIASFCAQGTMIPISKWPGLKVVTFWPDPDSSVIEFAGGRRKFSRMLSGFIDHGPGKEPEMIEVSYQPSGKPVLLQVADLVAYTAQRSAGAKFSPLDLKFKALDRQIGPEKLRLGVTPQGGIGFDIPNALLERRF
jgi:hypothetical protein